MGRKVSRFTLGEKRMIVLEAYASPSRVYATAKQYQVDLCNIKAWRKLLDEENLDSRVKLHRSVCSIQVQEQDLYEHSTHYFEVERTRGVP